MRYRCAAMILMPLTSRQGISGVALILVRQLGGNVTQPADDGLERDTS